MDKIRFLKEEITLVLDSFPNLREETKDELMKMINEETEDNLLELLKVLYTMRRDFINAQNNVVEATDEFIKSLNSKND